MTQRLTSREVRLAKILNNGLDLFEAVRVFSTEENFRTARKKTKRPSQQQPESHSNRWLSALQSLRELAVNENIPIAVIGGVATVHHGYERFTKDLDVVVSTQNFDQIVKVCYKYGFDIKTYNPTGMHELLYNGLEIEVLEEGMFAGDPNNPKAMPSPAELGVTHGLQFVPLEKWARLKLSGERSQDSTDIIEVLKRKTPEEYQAVEGYLRDFNPGYAQKFRQLAEDARREKMAQEAFFPKRQ